MNYYYLIFVIVPALGLVILKLLVFLKKKPQLEQTDQRKLRVQSKQDVTIIELSKDTARHRGSFPSMLEFYVVTRTRTF